MADNEFILNLNLSQLHALEAKLQHGIATHVAVDNTSAIAAINKIGETIRNLPKINIRIPNGDKIEAAAKALEHIKSIGNIDIKIDVKLPTEARMTQFVTSMKELQALPKIDLNFDATSIKEAAQAAAVLATSLRAINNIGNSASATSRSGSQAGFQRNINPGSFQELPELVPDVTLGGALRARTPSQINEQNRRIAQAEEAVRARSGEVNSARLFSRFGVGASADATKQHIIEEEAARLKLSSAHLFQGGKPSFPVFNKNNILSSEGIKNIGFSSILAGGGAAEFGGATLATGLFSPAAAATGALLARQAFEAMGKALIHAAEAGLEFQRSITAIAAVLNVNTELRGPGGRQLSVEDQLKGQIEQAEKIQRASRARLLPLGITGQAEATLVQAVVTGSAQKGIILNAEQVANISGRLGAAIQAQKPELFNNSTLLRRDVEDIFSGSPQASRTSVGAAVRPIIARVKNASNAEELEAATKSLERFEQSLNKLGTASIAFSKFEASIDQLNTAVGDEFLKGLAPGLAEFADSLLKNEGLTTGLKAIAAGIGQLASNLLYLGSALANTLDLPSKAGRAITQFIANALGIKTENRPSIRVEQLVDNALRSGGFDEKDKAKFIQEREKSPEVRAAGLEKAVNSLITRGDLSKQDRNILFDALGEVKQEALKERVAPLERIGLAGQVAAVGERTKVDFEILGIEKQRKGFLEKDLKHAENRFKFAQQEEARIRELGNDADTEAAQASVLEAARERNKAKLGLGQTQKGRENALADVFAQASNAVSLQSQLGQLQAAGIAPIGLSGQISRNSAEITGIAAAQAVLEAKKSEILNSGEDLSPAQKQQIQVFEAQSKAFDASVQVLQHNNYVLGLQQDLGGIDQGTFAGRIKASGVAREIAEADGRLSPAVAKAQEIRTDIDTKLSNNEANLGLVKSLESLQDATFQQTQKSRELNLALSQATRSLTEFDKETNLRNLESKNAILGQAKRTLEAGGNISGEYRAILENPDLQKDFNRRLEQERFDQAINKERTRPEKEAEERAKREIEIAGLNYQQGTLGRGVRDASFSYQAARINYAKQFTSDPTKLQNLFADASALTESSGRFVGRLDDRASLPPINLATANIGSLGEGLRSSAGEMKAEAKEALNRKLDDLGKAITADKRKSPELTKQDYTDAVAVGTRIAMQAEFS